MTSYHPDLANKEASECLKTALDNATGALSVIDGFLTQKTGRKVVINYTDATKETISTIVFYQGANVIYTLTYTSAATSDTYERTA